MRTARGGRVAVPARLLVKRLLPRRCLVTGARDGVELRRVDLAYWPWWLFPAGLLSLGLVHHLISDRAALRLWLPLSEGPWRWHRWRWLYLPPLHGLLIGVSAAVTTVAAAPVRAITGVPGVAALFAALLFALSYLARALMQPHMVWLLGGDLELGVLLSLPDEEIAGAVRAEVQALSTPPEREVILATLG